MIDTHPTPATLPPSTEEAMQELGERLEAMIAIQIQAYPNWSLQDKREVAMVHLGFIGLDDDNDNEGLQDVRGSKAY